MKRKLEELLGDAIDSLISAGRLKTRTETEIIVERTRDPQHGDFASNLPLNLAKSAKRNPRELAQEIVSALPESHLVNKVEIAGPGFINFFIDSTEQYSIVRLIHQQGDEFGNSAVGAGKKVQIEFVSANPTGPLHVGHGRGAAYGSAIANLLRAVGFEVVREYYVNDAGRQMDILAVSIWFRYLEECGEVLAFPSSAYRGEYVRDIASQIYRQRGDKFRRSAQSVTGELPLDESAGGNGEVHIDAVIERAKKLLGAQYYRSIFTQGLDRILLDIRKDLEEFGVFFDEWFSERRLMESSAVSDALEKLRSSGYLYEKDGATWFSCSQLGDEKDRVVVRDNGQTTYLASDIAYHINKFERGFDSVIDIWGADHHGYIPRVKAALTALGRDASKLEVLLVQFAVLYRGQEKVQMSTRSGDFITLRQLRNEVGKDAARFFYMMRRCEQHMDFDLQLATAQSNDNPVYYVQYAHARICSVLRQLEDKNLVRDMARGMTQLDRLIETHEIALLTQLARYPEVLENSALKHQPHRLIQYLRELAGEFHTYYNAHQFLVEDGALRDARLNLICAIRQVVSNGLNLLGISAPEAM